MTKGHVEVVSPCAEICARASDRMWVIRIFLTIGGTAIYVFFNFYNHQILVISLLSYAANGHLASVLSHANAYDRNVLT